MTQITVAKAQLLAFYRQKMRLVAAVQRLCKLSTAATELLLEYPCFGEGRKPYVSGGRGQFKSGVIKFYR